MNRAASVTPSYPLPNVRNVVLTAATSLGRPVVKNAFLVAA